MAKIYKIAEINGQEYWYRTYGTRWGQYLEVIKGTEVLHQPSVRLSIDEFSQEHLIKAISYLA